MINNFVMFNKHFKNIVYFILVIVIYIWIFTMHYQDIGALSPKIKTQENIIMNLDDESTENHESTFKKRCLEKLTKQGFVLKGNCMKDLEKDFDSAILSMDLLEDQNLDIALKTVLEKYLNEPQSEYAKNYIKKLYITLDNCINSNLENSMRVEILKQLSHLISCIKQNNNNEPPFLNFLKSMMNAYKVYISRKVAQDVLEKNRSKINTLISSKSYSNEFSASVSANTSGIKIGSDVSFAQNEGADENSLYRIDREGNIRISFGGEIDKILEAEVAGNFGVTSSIIFYSLEQYLDSEGKNTSVLIRSETVNNIIKARKEMQKTEKLLLSGFKFYIEGYLKSYNIIPDMVYVEWPHITRIPYNYKAYSVKGGLDVTASALDSVGVSIRGTKENVVKIRSNPYLSLILDDCSPTDNLKARNIRKFFSKTYKHKGKKRNENMYRTVKHLIDKHQNNLAILYLILGDLRQYNSVLSIISAQEGKKTNSKEREIKHSIEKRWLNTKKFNLGHGRINILREAIIVSSYMREEAISSHEINVLKQIYQEIKQLAEMQNFSKGTKDASFNTSYKVNNYSIDGGINVAVPNFGDIELGITYQVSKGSKIDDGEDIEINVSLPVVSGKIIGNKEVSKCLVSLSKKLNSNGHSDLKQLSTAFSLASEAIPNILSNYLDMFTQDIINNVVKTNESISMNVCLTKVERNEDTDIPLPEQNKIIRDKDKWALKFIKICHDTIKSVKMISKNSSNHMIIMGNDTLSYIISRYNVFRIGLNNKDTSNKINNDTNCLWESFKTINIDSFKDIFNNIVSNNSNSRYELQCLFSDINNSLNLNKNNTNFKKICDTTFQKFLLSCDEFKNYGSEESLQNCLRLLDEILNIEFNECFIVEFNKLFSIV